MVHRARRLVEEIHLRGSEQRARDGQRAVALDETVGQVARHVIGDRAPDPERVQPERLHLDRLPDPRRDDPVADAGAGPADAGSGALKLTVNRGAGRGARWSRTFVPGETREVRIYLHGGADRVSGNWKGGPIRVRVIHAGNGALAVDPGLAGVAVYDSTDSWKPPRKPFDPGEMMRDWGGSTGIAPWLNQRSGMGLVLGGGPVITRFGFRRYPYAWRVAARAAYVTGTRAVNLDLKSDFRLARPGTGIRFDAGALWGEAVYFFGFGNQTERVEESDFYRLHQKRFQVNPRLYLELGKRGRIAAGPVVHHSVSDESKPSLARIERPYGFGSFTAVGGSIGGSLDLRDDPVYPVRGIRAEAEGRWFPAVGDVAEQFGVIRGELSGYLGTRSLPATPVVAVRVGGAHGMGPLPFFEAPAIGGTRTVRGFTRDRFTGQSALYGNAELRLRFGWFKLVLPGEWGVFGMGDIGRVYLEGESSSLWHKTWGGGLWVSFFERKPAFSLAWARGSDGGKFYLSGGLHF